MKRAVYGGRLHHAERADIHVRRGVRFLLEEGTSDPLGFHPFLTVVTIYIFRQKNPTIRSFAYRIPISH